MNVSVAFQGLTKKQYQLTQKQRFIVLGMIALIVIFIFLYTTTSDADVTVQPNPPGINAQSSGKALNQAIYQVSQTAQVMRDPFAAPPQITDQHKDITSLVPRIPNNVPRNIPSSVPKSIIPNIPYGNLKLTGIVSTGDQHLAVIKSANSSKSYSLNESIGADKIIAITNDYVILANGDKKTVLRLEQFGQKGGTYSEN